jgi:tetratricopeptide (TPR) repeat protein
MLGKLFGRGKNKFQDTYNQAVDLLEMPNRSEAAVSLLKEAVKLAEKEGLEESEEYRAALARIAYQLAMDENYQESLIYYNRVINLCEKLGIQEDPVYASSCMKFAYVLYTSQPDFGEEISETLDRGSQALLRIAALKPELFFSLLNEGIKIHQELNQKESLAIFLESAVERIKRSAGENSSMGATICLHTAGALDPIRDFRRVASFASEAKAIAARSEGVDSQLYQSAVLLLADIMYRNGRLDKGMRMLKGEIIRWDEDPKLDKGMLVSYLSRLTSYLIDNEQYDEADEMVDRATLLLDVLEKIDPQDQAILLLNKIWCRVLCDDIEGAMDVVDEMEAHAGGAPGETRESWEDSFSRLSEPFLLAGEFKQALECCKKFRRIYKSTSSELSDHSFFIRLQEAASYRGLGLGEKCEIKIRRLLDYLKEFKKEDTPQHAMALVELGKLAVDYSQFDEAEDLLSNAMAMAIDNHGEETVETGLVLCELGRLKMAQELLEDSEPFFERGKELLISRAKFRGEAKRCYNAFRSIKPLEEDEFPEDDEDW